MLTTVVQPQRNHLYSLPLKVGTSTPFLHFLHFTLTSIPTTSNCGFLADGLLRREGEQSSTIPKTKRCVNSSKSIFSKLSLFFDVKEKGRIVVTIG
jgi:hypothetical protein